MGWAAATARVESALDLEWAGRPAAWATARRLGRGTTGGPLTLRSGPVIHAVGQRPTRGVAGPPSRKNELSIRGLRLGVPTLARDPAQACGGRGSGLEPQAPSSPQAGAIAARAASRYRLTVPDSDSRNLISACFSVGVSPIGRSSGVISGLRPAALVVEVDDVGERLQAAVVHVGRGERDLAQRRRLELGLVALVLRHVEAAEVLVRLRVGVPRDAGVVQLLVGEQRLEVAERAARLRPEDLQSLLLLGGERVRAGRRCDDRTASRPSGACG